MNKYGLIGKNIAYSFSKGYFENKFSTEGIAASYENFDIAAINEIKTVFETKELRGLNVTIPYKEAVIPYLDAVDKEAEAIGAVNTIKFQNGKKTGHNTDCFGFTKAIFPLLEKHHKKALILGTGGASKAIAHGLLSLGLQVQFISRTPKKNILEYGQLSEEIIKTHHVIVNCTPLGTHPNTEASPQIPFQFISEAHLLYDLTYNPPLTKFLAQGKANGAKVSNGQKMLEFQAQKAWEIWNS